ncbi:hypothetical protein Tco_0522139 [Tanacetum coccineum]
MIIYDGVIKHTYYPKPRAKAYLENFDMDEDEDWLGCFEVGRDEDRNLKYGHVAASFLDIEDAIERVLAMEATRRDIASTRRRKETACGTPSLKYLHRVEGSSFMSSRLRLQREVIWEAHQTSQ